MKKYSILETNSKGTAVKIRFQTSNQSKAHQILSDFRNEDPENEFHLLALED